MNVLWQLQKKFEIYIWWNSGLHGQIIAQSVDSWWNELFPLYTVSTLYQYLPRFTRWIINKVLTLHYDFDHLDHLIREMLCKQPILGDIHALHFLFSVYKPEIANKYLNRNTKRYFLLSNIPVYIISKSSYYKKIM